MAEWVRQLPCGISYKWLVRFHIGAGRVFRLLMFKKQPHRPLRGGFKSLGQYSTVHTLHSGKRDIKLSYLTALNFKNNFIGLNDKLNSREPIKGLLISTLPWGIHKKQKSFEKQGPSTKANIHGIIIRLNFPAKFSALGARVSGVI